MVACFDGYIHLLVGEQLNKGAYDPPLCRQKAASESIQQHLKRLKRCFTSSAVAQYVGLAQGIQGTFGALSAVPGTW